MCYGYHARLSREEQLSLLEKRKKDLEERIKEVEKDINRLQPKTQPQPAPSMQAA